MLNKSSRVLVNIIGVPLLLAIILAGDNYFSIPFFSVFIIIVLLLGAKEIVALTHKQGAKPISIILMLFILVLQLSRYPLIDLDIPIHVLIVLLTLIGMVAEIFRNSDRPFLNISTILFGFIWIGIMLGSLSTLRNLPQIGFMITLSLFLSVWICDTSAFYFGKRFGNKKILPYVSPNKTWVGTIAGLISSIVFMLLIYKFNFFNGFLSFIDILVIGLISGGIGQLGDWLESLLKREAGVKDTSSLLMGHGGILDRFDSLIFSAPITLIYCNFFIKIV